jgi:hypothetical protein
MLIYAESTVPASTANLLYYQWSVHNADINSLNNLLSSLMFLFASEFLLPVLPFVVDMERFNNTHNISTRHGLLPTWPQH